MCAWNQALDDSTLPVSPYGSPPPPPSKLNMPWALLNLCECLFLIKASKVQTLSENPLFQSLTALIQSSQSLRIYTLHCWQSNKKSSGHLFSWSLYFFLPPQKKQLPPIPSCLPWPRAIGSPHLPPGPWKQSPTWNHDLGLHRCVWEPNKTATKIHKSHLSPPGRNDMPNGCFNIVVSTNVGMDVRDDEEHVLRWRSPFSLKEFKVLKFLLQNLFFSCGCFSHVWLHLFFFGGGLRVAFFVPGLVFLLILQWSLQNFTVRKWKTFTSCWKLVPNRQREDWPQGIPTDWQRVQPWSLGGHKISEGFYLFPIRSSFFLKETKIIRWASTSYKWNYNPYRCPGGFMNTQVKQLYTSRGGGLVLAQPKLLCRLEGTLPEEWFNLYIS